MEKSLLKIEKKTVAGEKVRASAQLYISMLLSGLGVSLKFDRACKTASCRQVGPKKFEVTSRPVPDVVDVEQAHVFVALIVHECMHAFLTNFEMLKDLKPNEGHLQNILEDVWGEKNLPSRIPGSMRIMQDGVSAMLKLKLGIFCTSEESAEGAKPISAFLNWLLFSLRSEVLGQVDLLPGAAIWRKKIESLIGSDLVERLWLVAMKISTNKNTQGAIEITRDLLAMLKQEAEEDQQGQDDKQPSEAGEEKEDSESDDSQQGAGDTAESSQGPTSAGGGEIEDTSPSTSGCGDEPSEAERRSAIKSILESQEMPKTEMGEILEDAAEKSGLYKQGGTPGDVFDQNPLEAVLMEENVAKLSSGTTVVANGLGLKLERELEALVERHIRFRDTGAKISSSRLPRVAFHDYRVFKRTSHEVEIDTAVSVIIDISGSMSASLGRSQSAIDVACQATWALGDVLNRFDIPFSIMAFGSSTSTVKSFSQNWKQRRNFGWASLQGATVTHSALYKSFGEMSQRDEKRKLIVLVTDGEPSNTEATSLAIKQAESFGIETALLFIANGEPQMVSSLEDLKVKIKPSTVSSGDGLSSGIFESIRGSLKS